jgi:mannose-binding lectin 2
MHMSMSHTISKFYTKTDKQFIHSIITVNTYSAILSPADYPRDKLRSINPFNSSSSSGSGSWFGFFFKLFLFAGVCVGAFYGYQIYLEKNGRATYGGAFGGPGGRYGGGLNHYVERFTGNSKRF